LAETDNSSNKQKTAFETTDNPYFNDSFVMKVNELGLPDQEIMIDLESKDLSLFWRYKEKYLHIILGICAIYFLSVLFEGGFFGKF